MSSAKGRSAKKQGPPAHQNKFGFRHNPGSKKTKKIMAIEVSGLCRRCTDVLEWKKKYRKYKPRKAPGKCTSCLGKKVKKAYHALCDECAQMKGVCPKCMESHALPEPEGMGDEELLRRLEEGKIAGVRERDRRAVIRELTLGLTPEYSAKKDDMSDGGDDGGDGGGDDGDDSDGDEGVDGGEGGGGCGEGDDDSEAVIVEAPEVVTTSPPSESTPAVPVAAPGAPEVSGEVVGSAVAGQAGDPAGGAAEIAEIAQVAPACDADDEDEDEDEDGEFVINEDAPPDAEVPPARAATPPVVA